MTESTATEIAIRAIRREERQRCADQLRKIIDTTSYNRGDVDWSVDGHAVSDLADEWSRG